MDNVLSLLGLARKAGRLAIGEEPVGAAARARDARLILLARDASDNSARRAARFAEAGDCLLARIPADKVALGAAVGRASCAMLAVTDVGFADAIGKRLAALDAARYGALSERLRLKADRAAARRRAQQRRDKRAGQSKPRKT